jgi:hypothetical protein
MHSPHALNAKNALFIRQHYLSRKKLHARIGFKVGLLKAEV